MIHAFIQHETIDNGIVGNHIGRPLPSSWFNDRSPARRRDFPPSGCPENVFFVKQFFLIEQIWCRNEPNLKTYWI